MSCIKTGARVYLVEYGQTLPADVFAVGNCLVFHFNMSAFDTNQSHWGNEAATHAVTTEPNEGSYWNKDDGILVVPRHYAEEL